ncbi:uncharacterized protein LOC111897972 [Lactuca sativa]|uniref:uncharacterized protein LOC111897972 n=1 Tax=Lactuca sativa TaxID=4236 RepID=UPI000CD87293|nr:uncharacterized protein LOC111897972 [Lactuca sativa]
MGENVALGNPLEEAMDDNGDVYLELPNIFNEKLHWKEREPVLGIRFKSPKQLKHMLCNYAVANGYQLGFLRNDSRWLLAKCCDGKCTFRVWGSWMSDDKSFQIKSLISDHNCSEDFKFESIITYRLIGTHFTQQFFNNQKMSVRLEEVKTTFGIVVSMSECKRAKKYALSLVEGTVAKNYARLWSYGEENKRSNPGSTIKIYVDTMLDGKNYFSNIYICFATVIEGWKGGCRRIINLDGCFSKKICQGELLCALGRDANNGIFTIAWAVVCV